MVDVVSVSNWHIVHQIGDFFAGAVARTREQTGISHEDEEFVYGMRTTIREHLCHESDALRVQRVAIQTRQARRRTAFALMVTMFFVAGCGGIHMHRPEDAQLARNASAAFKDAKLTEALKTEFDAAAELLNGEIAAIRRQSNARRDRLISAIIGGTLSETSWGRVEVYADSRLAELLGPKPAGSDWSVVDTWIQAQGGTFNEFNLVRQFYLDYEQIRTSMDPRITRIGARLSEEEKCKLGGELELAYGQYLESLNKYEAAVKKANSPPSMKGKGVVDAIINLRDEQEKKLGEADEAAQNAKEKLNDLKTEREKKIKEAEASGKKADEISKALKVVADKMTTDKVKIFQDLLDAASARGLAGVQEKITVLEEIRGQIAELLPIAADAVAGKKPPPRDSEKIRLLASVTAIRAGIDGATYPRISDLILESERLRIELDRLRGLVALEEERKTLLDLQLTALSREITALRRAQTEAKEAKPWGVLAAEQSASKQKAAASALAYIAESWSSGRTPAEEIDFLITGIDHRAALENSSAAFAQWSNLIGVPLAQLVAYHESGIKSGDMANLINAAGFSAIAAGLY